MRIFDPPVSLPPSSVKPDAPVVSASHCYSAALAIRRSWEKGAALSELTRDGVLDLQAVEDLLELSDAHPGLGALIDQVPLTPVQAVMLHRRFQGWVKRRSDVDALKTAQHIVGHVRAAGPSMKAWRFLLDFYWKNEAPFRAR